MKTWEVHSKDDKKKPAYTTKMHVHRLKQMLKKSNPCLKCPACVKFKTPNYIYDLWHRRPCPCDTCRSFIGLPIGPPHRCPCNTLGDQAAIEHTMKAIREYDNERLH